MILRALVLMLALSPFLAGCSRSPIAGTWKMVVSNDLKNQLRASGKNEDPVLTIGLNDDHTLRMHVSGDGKTGDAEGTWRVDGKMLTIRLTKVDGAAITGKNVNEQICELADDMKSFTMGASKFIKQ